ncbi:transposase [Kitasatospora mediocidica]|uniref:transposase n=1 Tax=Kitasatospora mediocidica TaxID=58352 RepID=UPI0038BD74E5
MTSAEPLPSMMSGSRSTLLCPGYPTAVCTLRCALSLVVLGTQSLHAAAGVQAVTTGRDAAKKVPGRKRGLAVDVLGLVIAAVVPAASVHDNAFGTALLDKVAAGTAGTVTKALEAQRLTGCNILTETEPGLFTLPRT